MPYEVVSSNYHLDTNVDYGGFTSLMLRAPSRDLVILRIAGAPIPYRAGSSLSDELYEHFRRLEQNHRMPSQESSTPREATQADSADHMTTGNHLTLAFLQDIQDRYNHVLGNPLGEAPGARDLLEATRAALGLIAGVSLQRGDLPQQFGIYGIDYNSAHIPRLRRIARDLGYIGPDPWPRIQHPAGEQIPEIRSFARSLTDPESPMWVRVNALVSHLGCRYQEAERLIRNGNSSVFRALLRSYSNRAVSEDLEEIQDRWENATLRDLGPEIPGVSFERGKRAPVTVTLPSGASLSPGAELVTVDNVRYRYDGKSWQMLPRNTGATLWDLILE